MKHSSVNLGLSLIRAFESADGAERCDRQCGVR